MASWLERVAAAHLHEALAKAPWTKLYYELRPPELANRLHSSPNS